MLKKIFIIIMLSYSICGFSQYYIGYTTTMLNLRECPSTECNVICQMPKHSTIFIFTDNKIDGFYKVIFIDKDIEGYASENYIKLQHKVSVDKNGTLQKIGQATSMWPTISIENKCEYKTTLRLNSKTYYLKPYEQREIVSDPGQVLIIASSPGISPYVGADVLENNSLYWWQFYVVNSKNEQEDTNTVYVCNIDKRYYHKTDKCLHLEGATNIIRYNIKNAMNKDLSPCPYCYDIKH